MTMLDEAPVVDPVTHAVVPADESRDIVLRFLTGESLSDIATFYGKHRQTVERVLRHAYTAMSESVGHLSHNDGVTQRKITALEATAATVEAFMEMTFWQRLRWIFRGVK